MQNQVYVIYMYVWYVCLLNARGFLFLLKSWLFSLDPSFFGYNSINPFTVSLFFQEFWTGKSTSQIFIYLDIIYKLPNIYNQQKAVDLMNMMCGFGSLATKYKSFYTWLFFLLFEFLNQFSWKRIYCPFPITCEWSILVYKIGLWNNKIQLYTGK